MQRWGEGGREKMQRWGEGEKESEREGGKRAVRVYEPSLCAPLFAQNLLTFSRKWVVLDAKGQTVGRLATQLASVLQGE